VLVFTVHVRPENVTVGTAAASETTLFVADVGTAPTAAIAVAASTNATIGRIHFDLERLMRRA
jgi:hypothetical protein